MHMLAELVELVIGVDTHKHTHTAAVVVAATGAVVNQATAPATPAGYQQLLRLAARQPGERIWAVEGTGGYGAGLTRFLHANAEQVVELDRPKRASRRHGAKSDPLDATRAAREALGRDQLAQPRAAGQRAALQVRLAARRSAVQAATDTQRQLHALVVAAPDIGRGRMRGLSTPRLVTSCARLRQRTDWDVQTTATAVSLPALARRIQLLDAEITEHTRAITTLVRAWRPDLLSRTGGPNRGRHRPVRLVPSRPLRKRRRLRHARRGRPIPASSGQTVRVRLNRSSDRQLNQALHVVVLTRLRTDPATRAYAQRRRAQGKTNPEIKRCLVRYVARQLYRLLEAAPAFDPTSERQRNDMPAAPPGAVSTRWVALGRAGASEPPRPASKGQRLEGSCRYWSCR